MDRPSPRAATEASTPAPRALSGNAVAVAGLPVTTTRLLIPSRMGDEDRRAGREWTNVLAEVIHGARIALCVVARRARSEVNSAAIPGGVKVEVGLPSSGD